MVSGSSSWNVSINMQNGLEKFKPYKTLPHWSCLVGDVVVGFPHIFANDFGCREGDKHALGSKFVA
jgi:hypothetical protein